MIAHHAAIAGTLAAQLELPAGGAHGLRAAYERWDGRGWPGELAAEDVPRGRSDRLSRRVPRGGEPGRRGGGGAAACARTGAAGSSTPRCRDLVEAEAEAILSGLDDVGTWDAVIAAEPALAIVVSGERFDAALLALANFVDLKSPYFLGHARAVADLAAAAGARLGLTEPRGPHPAPRRARPRPRPARRLERRPRTRRPARRRRLGATPAAAAPAPSACSASPRRSRRWPRSPSSTASGSTAPAIRAGCRVSDLAARRGSSAPPTPTRRCASRVRTGRRARPRRPLPSCAPRCGPAASTPRRPRPCSAPPATASRAAARGRPGSPSARWRC